MMHSCHPCYAAGVPGASRPFAVAALTLLILAPSEVRAQGRTSDEQVTRRIAFIQERLERAGPSARLWWNAWFAAYMTLTIGEGAAAIATSDQGIREDSAVGAVTSALALLPMGLFDFEPLDAASRVHAMPEATVAERRLKLASAERLLRASADTERFGRSWVMHVVGGSVAVGSGLVLALVYDRRTSGVVNALAGVAVSEAQILTQPTAAIDDWEHYSAGRGLGSTTEERTGLRVSVAALPGAFALCGVF